MSTKSIAWNTGSGYIHLTYQGQGNGIITVESDDNDLGTSRSQVITVKTTQGGVVTKNLTIKQAACPFPVGDVKNFSYTGNVQSVLLPAGRYKLQCWGAQGGSNAAASSYSITAKAGGKGGYSEGELTLSSPTIVYIFVGGQGSSSGNGGWNGGGGGTGSSTYNANNEQGVSRFGCGGGATDIALTTSSMSYSDYRNDRSSASLLSRMIVAGGGSGGAMAYKKVTTTTYTTVTDYTLTTSLLTFKSGSTWYFWLLGNNTSFTAGRTYTIHKNNTAVSKITLCFHKNADQQFASGSSITDVTTSEYTFTAPSGYPYFSIRAENSTETTSFNITITHQESSSSVTTDTKSQVGYVGGGTSGDGYSNSYKGRQNAAGSGGAEFGKGAKDSASNYRYCAGCGGGGWYGGGSTISDSDFNAVKYSGGGSGFVNTAASAGNRPSGYTGLQLDSGTTYAGDTSFPNTAGTGNETGHSGDGYAKITRLA